ncbi:MAG TPA: helix-turn-helix domain-containing protein [Chitinophagaceae bacterium]|nr:helix-turn-helix domain-containing protein [Chitinophagaceae bacterium]
MDLLSFFSPSRASRAEYASHHAAPVFMLPYCHYHPMKFSSNRPTAFLQLFIDSYFHVSGSMSDEEQVALMPDCGHNVLMNLREDIRSTRFERSVTYDGLYMVGPMLQTDVQLLKGEVSLFVVRFKPGAFPYFYKYHSLDHCTGRFHEFQRKDFPDIRTAPELFFEALDQFYARRLSPPKHSVLEILATIRKSTVPLRIHELAKRHFITTRQLERLCKIHIGLSPKEIVDLHRFSIAFAKLQSKEKPGLAEIAFDCGYYDHAHLTNDFKRFKERIESGLKALIFLFLLMSNKIRLYFFVFLLDLICL